MLKGSELLAKVKELKDLNKSDLVRECGYTDKNGKLCYTAFYEALLEAKGFEMKSNSKRGRALTYKTKVQFNGKLQIGEGYVQEMASSPVTSLRSRLVASPSRCRLPLPMWL